MYLMCNWSRATTARAALSHPPLLFLPSPRDLEASRGAQGVPSPCSLWAGSTAAPRGAGDRLKALRQKRHEGCSTIFHFSNFTPNCFAMRRKKRRKTNNISSPLLMFSRSDLAAFGGIRFEDA